MKACQEGRSARFFTAAEPANILLEKKNKETLNNYLGTLKKVELVVIGEIDFIPLHKDAAELLFQNDLTQASESGVVDYLLLIISAIDIIISGIAIWFAVSVPAKIAARQNKIALFDKRFEFYDILYQYSDFMDAF